MIIFYQNLKLAQFVFVYLLYSMKNGSRTDYFAAAYSVTPE